MGMCRPHSRHFGTLAVREPRLVQYPGFPVDKSLVGLSSRQRRMLGRGLRDLVFRGCTGVGGFLGFSLALKDHRTSPQRVPSACHTHAHAYAHAHLLAHTFAQCIDPSLMEAMLSWLIPVGLGLLIGAFVGCLLALMIPVGRRPKNNSSPNGRWIRARYWGKCRSCGCSVMPGDRIRHRPGHALCTSCGER